MALTVWLPTEVGGSMYDARTELRVAVYAGDGPTVVEILARPQPWPDDALQVVGDGLSIAHVRQAPGAAELAGRCVRALRGRGWCGDVELADQLDGLFGVAPTPMLRPLPVDLDELAGLLEGDLANGGGRIDRDTGDVWPRCAIEYVWDVGYEKPDEMEDGDRWLPVRCQGSRAAYRDMALFIDTVTDPGRADRLGIASEGRGAVRRFKDVLSGWPDEMARWSAFCDERQRGRARAWLADAGYRVAPWREPKTES